MSALQYLIWRAWEECWAITLGDARFVMLRSEALAWVDRGPAWRG